MSEGKTISPGAKISPLFIIGATASGKTRLAVRLAQEFSAEIISADSRQVYRGMDVGTGKDLQLYAKAGVSYHLIDVVEPSAEFNLFLYQREFAKAYGDVKTRGHNVIVAGGTGLYLSAIIEGYSLPPVPVAVELRKDLERLSREQLCERLLSLKPKLHNKTDITEQARTIRAIEIAMAPSQVANKKIVFGVKPLFVGIRWQMDVLRERIAARLRERVSNGLVEEVAALHAAGVSWERMDALGLEYRYVSLLLRGAISPEEMFKTLNIRIGQFAKRQSSWFRRMERKGHRIHWLEGDDYSQALEIVTREWR